MHFSPNPLFVKAITAARGGRARRMRADPAEPWVYGAPLIPHRPAPPALSIPHPGASRGPGAALPPGPPPPWMPLHGTPPPSLWIFEGFRIFGSKSPCAFRPLAAKRRPFAVPAAPACGACGARPRCERRRLRDEGRPFAGRRPPDPRGRRRRPAFAPLCRRPAVPRRRPLPDSGAFPPPPGGPCRPKAPESGRAAGES
jgi:hypothetical protein